MVLSIHSCVRSFILSYDRSIASSKASGFVMKGRVSIKKDSLLICSALLSPLCLKMFDRNCCLNYPLLYTYCRQRVAVL